MGTNEKRRARSIRQLIVIVLAIAALAGGVFWYDRARARERFVTAHFSTVNGATAAFDLEVADDPRERQKGLMYRKPEQLGEREGMIFVFPTVKVQSFHMLNTFVPLDMVFVGEDMKVVGVVRDVPILSEASRSVPKPARYVVELHAGTAAHHGIDTGSVLTLSRPLVARE